MMATNRRQRTPRNATADSNRHGRIRSGTDESPLRCFAGYHHTVGGDDDGREQKDGQDGADGSRIGRGSPAGRNTK
jgi:hypothetical protein